MQPVFRDIAPASHQYALSSNYYAALDSHGLLLLLLLPLAYLSFCKKSKRFFSREFMRTHIGPFYLTQIP